MQKIKKLVMVFCLFLGIFLIAACQKTESNYEQAMEKAKQAIIEKKFEQAEGFVELALENKKEDKLAKSYQTQLQSYQEALKLKKDKKEKEAKEKFLSVTKVKDGSNKLVEYAEKEVKLISEPVNKSKNKIPEKKETKKEALWNENKSKELSSFMSSWGESMGQKYKSYTAQESVDFYGLQLPKDIFDDKVKMAVNEQPVSVSWSDDGNGNAEYNLVEVYSDAESQPYLGKHLYFFTFKDGQPIVLITEQNQGNEKNYLHFKETASADLKNGFMAILEGKEASTPEKQTSHFDGETTTALNAIKGTYFENGEGNAVFSIDDEFYHDLVNNKDYPLSSIGKDEQGVYNIAWDIEQFEQIYGARSAGPGPQPFMYRLVSDTNGVVLEDLTGKTYTQK